MSGDLTRDVLEFFAGENWSSELRWEKTVNGVQFSLMCSDTFWWGTADSEPITDRTFPVLVQARCDLAALGDHADLDWLEALYVARVRGMRPMHLVLNSSGSARPLLEAAGPERERGLSNP